MPKLPSLTKLFSFASALGRSRMARARFRSVLPVALVFERLEDRKMLASISEDAGIVSVVGSSVDDVIVVSSDDSI